MDDHCAPQFAGSPAPDSVTVAAAPRSMSCLLIAGFCAYMNLYATQPLLPLLTQIFHASKFAVSLTVTAPPLGIALAAPVLGRLSDRWGRKRTMIWAAFGLSFSTILAGASLTLGQIIAWRFLQGLFTPGVFSVTVAYINEEWDSSRIGRALAVFQTGGVIGGCMGRTLAGVIAGHYHWRWAFVVLGCVNLIWAMALVKSLPRESRFVPAQASSLRLIFDHLRNRSLLATFLVGGCVLFSMLATFTYVNFHLAQPPYSMSVSALGMIFLVYPIGAFVTPTSGFLIRRLGRRGTILLALSTSAAGLLVSLGPMLTLVVVGLAMFVSGVFVAQTSATGFVGQRAKTARTASCGLQAHQARPTAPASTAITRATQPGQPAACQTVRPGISAPALPPR